MTSPDHLTTAEVAQRLEVSVSTVHRLVASGALAPARKLHGLRGALLFRRTDVERYAKKRSAA